MKAMKLFLSIIVIIGFIIIQHGNKPTIAKENNDLKTIAAVLSDKDIMINEWTLHAREHLISFKSDREVEEYAKSLQAKFPDWTWTVAAGQHKKEITAVSPASTHHQEKLQMITTHTKNKLDAYVLYQAKGDEWNKESQAFLAENFDKRVMDIFREYPTIFSCVKGVFSDKIDSALPDSVKKVLSGFDAREIEALKEDTFISVSAYSPLLGKSITAKQDNMNLQIALRTQGLGAKTTIVVGTPIITIEY